MKQIIDLTNLMIIYFKSISEESFSFNSNAKIIDANLKFLIKVTYKKQIQSLHQRSDSA